VRGVIHAAGAWRDIALSAMEADHLADVLAPKMAGTWNLERQLGQEPLDFFVSFSSLSALIPAHGQANYAAGNAFLDAHAAWRRAQGRPGLSVNWGPWSGVGFGATEVGLRAHNRLESFGIHRIAPEEAFAALDAVLGARVGQMAVCRIDWQTLAQVDPQLATSPLLTGLTHHLLAATAGRAQGFSPQDAQSSVRKIVAAVLRQPAAEVQANVPLTHLGLDSLMAMEIKNRILAETAVNISIAQFLTGASVQSLAEWVDAAWQLSRMAEAVSTSSEVAEDEQFSI
jgi:acyl carrier protein